MRGLTDKQRAMLDFIEEFIDEEGMAPTVYEISDRFNIKTSTVFAHIQALQRKGHLTRSTKARSISLQNKKKTPKHMSFILPIPLLGRINAGMPVIAEEYIEGEVFCDKNFIKVNDPAKLFALTIHGESMRDLGILDGDIVIVKQADTAKSGDVVAALIDDETTVKTIYFKDGKTIELKPANPDFKSQFYPTDKISIQGVIVGLQRKY